MRNPMAVLREAPGKLQRWQPHRLLVDRAGLAGSVSEELARLLEGAVASNDNGLPAPIERACQVALAIILGVLAAPRGQTRFDLRIADWGLSLNLASGKAVLNRANRPDLAHLTISWKKKSGEVSDFLDVHLTFGHEQAQAAGRTDKDWRPFARIPMQELERLGEHAGLASKNLFHGELLRILHRTRPGWLARRGYWVVLTEAEKFMSLLHKVAPKEGRKYRVRHERLQNPDLLTNDAGRCMEIFDPGVLHVLDPTKFGAPIMAVSERHGHRRMFLLPIPGLDGTVHWMSMNEAAMMRAMNKVLSAFFDWMVPRVQPEHALKLEELLQALGTGDFEITRDIGNGLRQFFAAPRNAVRMPYPKVRGFAAALDGAAELAGQPGSSRLVTLAAAHAGAEQGR